jgi:Family of unknown function (DUF6289)
VRNPSWSRRLPALIVLLALALLLSGAPSGPTASATTRSGHEFIYYSDATYTTVVGVQVWCSNGSHSGWGQVTPYYKIEPSGC